jgi:DNA-binding beta-propeller fold protein YncE
MSLQKARSYRRRHVLLALGLAALAGLSSPNELGAVGDGQEMPTVYVLDAGRKTVHAASFASGLSVSSPTLSEEPGYLALAPDGNTLLAFTKAPLSLMTGATDSLTDGRSFLRPKAPNAVSIIDTRTMTVRATIDRVGWNAAPVAAVVGKTLNGGSKTAQSPPTLWGAWDSSGRRFTVVCLGKNDQPAEAVQIDIPSASVVGRLPLADRMNDVSGFLPLTAGETSAVLCKNSVVLIDLHDVSRSRVIPVAGDMLHWVRSPRKDALYVHGSGERGSGLQVISLKSLTVTKTLSVPFVTAIANDDERNHTFVAGGTKATSFLTVFRGEEQLAVPVGDEKGTMLPLAGFPLALKIAPKTRRLYVLCYDSIQVVDLETLSVVGSILSPHRTTGVWDNDMRSPAPPSLLALDSTELRGFLSYLKDDEISFLDLKTLKVVSVIDVVSGLGNFARTLAANAAAGAAAGAKAAQLGVPVRAMPPPDIIELPPARYSSMMVGPDDRFLYVLDANRLRVIDITVSKKRGDVSVPLSYISSFEFRSGARDSFLLVHGIALSDSLLSLNGARSVPKVAVFETRTNKRLKGNEFGSDIAFTPDGRFAIHFDDRTVHCSDVQNWSTVKKIGGFKRITQVIGAGIGESNCWG